MANARAYFVFLCLSMILTSCTHLPAKITGEPKPTRPVCSNIDWFEVGRADGSSGSKADKSTEYETRCQGSPSPFDRELYTNGKNAGVVEYCTASRGFDAGRAGSAYEGVCPEHLEKTFLANYEIGKRVHDLENENQDLQSRIDNLVHLLAPAQSSGSMASQIEQLRRQRAANETEINTLETQASSLE